ncbi:VOC family virulence protein [Halobacteriales archaeon QS_1_68_17]|nr:MAG: VOC family virulence protein [Halobacteriales archaeon QS_1_68_17]
MEITGIDHFVLTVDDIDETCRFYEDVLGLDVVRFSGGRYALQVGDQKINLHPTDADVEPKAAAPTVGGGDFCLLADLSIEAVRDRLDEAGVDLAMGPIEREGARGPMRSVYVRDPDGNLVEVATYQ